MPTPLPDKNPRRGNPNWGKSVPFAPTLPTEFEVLVKQLRLTAETYTSSAKLRTWCERHKNHFYVPEWLLDEWNITVDPNISGVMIDRPRSSASSS